MQSYGPAKLAIKKYSRPFGFEATFFARLHIELLLSERPGFDPRRAQTLRAHIFGPLWSTGTKTSFFEISNLYLLGQKEKKHFAALLRHIILSQNTPKSYHNRPKSRFNLQGTVFSKTLISSSTYVLLKFHRCYSYAQCIYLYM